MTELEALLMFERARTARCDGGRRCREVQERERLLPVSAVGLAVCSGGLQDAQTWSELADCLDHGLTLLSCGVYSVEEIGAEISRIAREAMNSRYQNGH